MPAEDQKILKFIDHHKQLKSPYIVYTDFAALTTKIEGTKLDRPRATHRRPSIMRHAALATLLLSVMGILYRGTDAATRFLEHIGKEETKIKRTLSNTVPMEMTPKDTIIHDAAQDCHVCGKPLNGDSVRDHFHITSRYRGAAHNSCNLKLRMSAVKTHIPVVFHNLWGYDSHLIMQAISQEQGQVTCIPYNMEKYISFSLRSLRFIDSAQFLQASLNKLVIACPKEAFAITQTFQPNNTDLLMKKWVYPYEYMRFWDSIEVFYNQLTDEGISEAEYQHALKVWETFSCQNLGDYHDLYLKTDVLLLADVFENFRKTCQVQHGLDPAHYYTSPGLSWDALLKKTGMELELLADYDMFLFIEKGLRGGVSMVSQGQQSTH
jgi:hypothetical protein